MDRAKELFLKYGGSRFHMDREGDGAEYDSYHISKETEEMWTRECIARFLESELKGREAHRAYAEVTELLKSDRSDEDWDRCLYYPLRAGHPDDVTILYMLSDSFRLAERAVKRNRFSREEAAAYLKELDGFTRPLLARANSGTMTRAADYVLQEFSDPAYVADYLDDLKKKWKELF